MKTLKTILSVFAIAAVFSAGAYAQETADVTVQTEVVTALNLTVTNNINLGTIQAGTASTIAAGNSDATTTEANLGVGAQFGTVTIAGSNGAAVDVDFTDATLTENTTPATEAAFTTIAYSAEADAGAGLFSSGDQINLDGSGNATIDLGGTLASTTAGSYNTGNGGNGSPITVTVTYQ